MRIVHFQRKPVSERYFSIENYFASIRGALQKKGAEVQLLVCPHISQGLFKRVANTVWAAFRQGDVNHVTGDVHYLDLLLSTKKTILTIHDCVFMKHPNPLARKVLQLFWLTLPAKKAAYITCISEATKAEVLRFVTFDPSKVLVIPTVVNESLFLFRPKAFDQENPQILFVGTTANKNLERVAAALKGIKCRLEIVGPLDGSQKAQLIACGIDYGNEVGISNERMAEKYFESDMLLFPSTYEGFGMPILEAQLTGRPVVTSDYSSMPEVAMDSACLVDPFDVESIRRGILKIMEDEQYRESLIQKGKANVKRFSPDLVAQLFLDLYVKVGRK